MFDLSQLFWRSSVEDLTKGYVYGAEQQEYICLICGESFIKGRVYPDEGAFYEAEPAAVRHVEKSHGSVFDYLVNMSATYTGLSDIQKDLILYFYNGLNDKEISKKQGGISESTVRVHRFKMKEREKQAKIFLALMNLLAKKQLQNKVNIKVSEAEMNAAGSSNDLVHVHRNARKVDERYAMSTEEQRKLLKVHFTENGKLKDFNLKVKHKIAVLLHIVTLFDSNKKYSEKEVNEVLKTVYPDFATLRRALIEYGFMAREKDGSSYWVED